MPEAFIKVLLQPSNYRLFSYYIKPYILQVLLDLKKCQACANKETMHLYHYLSKRITIFEGCLYHRNP